MATFGTPAAAARLPARAGAALASPRPAALPAPPSPLLLHAARASAHRDRTGREVEKLMVDYDTAALPRFRRYCRANARR